MYTHKQTPVKTIPALLHYHCIAGNKTFVCILFQLLQKLKKHPVYTDNQSTLEPKYHSKCASGRPRFELATDTLHSTSHPIFNSLLSFLFEVAHAPSAEACLTGWPNVQPQGRD